MRRGTRSAHTTIHWWWLYKLLCAAGQAEVTPAAVLAPGWPCPASSALLVWTAPVPSSSSGPTCVSGCEFWSVLVAIGTSVSSHISNSRPVSICTCFSYWGKLFLLNVAVYFPKICRKCMGFVSYCLLAEGIWGFGLELEFWAAKLEPCCSLSRGVTAVQQECAPLELTSSVLWSLVLQACGPVQQFLNSSLYLLLVELPSVLGCKYIWVNTCPSFAYTQIPFGYKTGFVFLLGHLYCRWGFLPRLETWAVPGMELLLHQMGKLFGFLFCGLKRFSLIFSTLFKLCAANSIKKVLSEAW